ncbi:sulfatase [Gemmatimonadota bacterium]
MKGARDGMIDRRGFVSTTATAAGGFLLGGLPRSIIHVEGRQERPNILWLIAEDLSPDIGCYGTDQVQTPNIDRLAREGTRFTSAFATAPVCSASRSALMTGMYQTSIGAHQHRTDPKGPLPGGVSVITERFREAGWFTCNQAGNNRARAGKTDLNFISGELFDGIDWSERSSGQPFFAQVNFSETHRNFTRDPDRPVDPDQVDLPPYYPDHPVTRRDWADYLECAQNLDRKVGTVLSRLEEEGLAEDTIVFFFGDHGRAHVRGKQFLYEGGIRVPLIIRWPGGVGEGNIRDDLVSLIDLAPTAMRMAGIDPPDHLHGLPLPEEGNGREFIIAARDRCDETFDRIRCVRDRRYKYIRNFYPNLPWTQTNLYKLRQYPVLTLLQVLHARGDLTPEQARFMAPGRPPEELYDLENDPHEVRNLAEVPARERLLNAMRDRLETWITELGDIGEEPEDPAVAARIYRELSLPNQRRTMEQRGLFLDVSPGEYLAWWKEWLQRP